jgi:ABC-type multidrug transport system ATPase subunit
MIDVALDQVSKTYNKGEVQAVKEVSFEVERGELFGLIGPDGAGKTSLFRILTTLLVPNGGKATVLGHDVVDDYKEIRQHLGYMPGKFSLYQDLSVEENLNFFATVFDTSIEENYDLVKDIYIQLEPFKNRRAGNLSGGMKQKLALCCALIHKPKVLLLDEPTTGVDSVSRKEFWEMLKRLKEQNITILVSTPYMDEATLCERIALIQQGEIMSIDTPQNIIREYPSELFAIRADDMIGLLSELRASQHVESCYSFGDYHHITLTSSTPENGLIGIRHELGNRVNTESFEIKKIEPTIEDCFIDLMN